MIIEGIAKEHPSLDNRIVKNNTLVIFIQSVLELVKFSSLRVIYLCTFLSGAGLLFIAYGQALTTFDGSSVFAIFFFLMIITLGLDSSVIYIDNIHYRQHGVLSTPRSQARYPSLYNNVYNIPWY